MVTIFFFLCLLQEGSWIASLSQLGAVFGCLFGGLILVKRGRKFALIFASIPFATAWIVAAFAEQVEVLYCSSFIAGFASAITLLASQVLKGQLVLFCRADSASNVWTLKLRASIIICRCM